MELARKGKDLLVYEPTYKVYYRPESRPVMTNKKDEFLYVLQTFFGDKKLIDETEFTRQFQPILDIETRKDLPQYGHENGYPEKITTNFGKTYCVCTHKIYHLRYIQHIETGKLFLVGICCIKKVSEKMAYTIQVIEQNRLCRCNKGIIFRTHKSGRDYNICQECYESIQSVGDELKNFGKKFKNWTYYDICHNLEGKKYIIDFLLPKDVIKDIRIVLYIKMELNLRLNLDKIKDWPFPIKEKDETIPIQGHKFLLK